MQSILIVDDEKTVRETLRAYLEQENYQISEAVNGNNAIELIKTTLFDLIILDLVMPDKEGIETIQEIKSLYPNLPILAISGKLATHGIDYLNLAVSLGANKSLKKPFSGQLLLETIKELV